MSIYTKIKVLVIAILVGVSSITYSAEEMPDGEKPTNKRNISTGNFNSNENTQLTKKQKLQYTPLEMNEYFPNDIFSLFFHFLTGEPLEESNFILTCKTWKAAADDYYYKKSTLKSKFINGKATLFTTAPLIYSMAICLRYWGYP